MTRRIGNLIIIAPEEAQQCDECGRTAELRPYGPNGKCICFACMQKSEVRCGARMLMRLYDVPRREAIAKSLRRPGR
jgi:hypothetical protein